MKEKKAIILVTLVALSSWFWSLIFPWVLQFAASPQYSVNVKLAIAKMNEIDI